MDNNYQNFKEEVEKDKSKNTGVSLKKQYPFKTAIFKFTNAECQFLAR